MTTPSKLSLKKKNKQKLAPVLHDEAEEEKENISRGFSNFSDKSSRRCSTIIAGNLVLDHQEDDSVASHFISSRNNFKRDKPHLDYLQEEQEEEKEEQQKASLDLITEDESSFYSCDDSLKNDKKEAAMMDTWMTEITNKDPATPRTNTNQGSAIKAVNFFSVGRRRTIDPYNRNEPVLVRESESEDEDIQGSDENNEMVGNKDCRAKLDFQKTFVGASDNEDIITDDEDEAPDQDDKEDSVPDELDVHLGKDFLSDSRFEKINNWVQGSPFRDRLSDYSSRIQKSPTSLLEDSDEEVESLLKSDPEDGDIVPSWAAPLPQSSSKDKSSTFQEERSSRDLLPEHSKVSSKDTAGSMFKSSKGMISYTYEFSEDPSTTNISGERSSKGILSFPVESSQQQSGENTNISEQQTSKETSSFPSGSGQQSTNDSGNKSSKALNSPFSNHSKLSQPSLSSSHRERNRISEFRNLSEGRSLERKKIVSTKDSSEGEESRESKIRSNQNRCVLSTNSASNKTSNFCHGLPPSNRNSDVRREENVQEKHGNNSVDKTIEKLETLQVSDASHKRDFSNCVKSPLKDVATSITNKDPIVITEDDDDVDNCNEIETSKIASGSMSQIRNKIPVKDNLNKIENSINAVRCWSEVKENKLSKKIDSDSDSDNFEKFLTKIKSNKKPIKRSSEEDSDKNFVVPDDKLSSDEFGEYSDEDVPILSLRDRILSKNKKTTNKLLDSSDDDEKGKKSKTKKKNAEVQISLLSSEDDGSLPDIDTETPVTRKTKTKDPKQSWRNLKKEDSWSSASEGEDSSPRNIYQPKFYNSIPKPFPTTKTTSVSKPKSDVKKVVSKEPKSSTKKSIPITPKSNFKTPTTLTFLSSLTMDTPIERCHPQALPYIKNFKKSKEELAKRLYQMYNDQIFEGALPDDMEISWNVRLTKTAGLCYSRRYKKYNIETRSSRIELSTKVIDRGDRLRDTLIHEMCHAASWIISGYRDGHGPLWRTWAEKAMRRYPELPVIDRCHSYQIETKYTYKCVQCGYSIGRHSKSLDTERKVCGHCHGRFELVVNTGAGAARGAPATPGSVGKQPKPPTGFAKFVQDNYKVYKQPGASHAEVMRTLSEKFSAAKISK